MQKLLGRRGASFTEFWSYSKLAARMRPERIAAVRDTLKDRSFARLKQRMGLASDRDLRERREALEA